MNLALQKVLKAKSIWNIPQRQRVGATGDHGLHTRVGVDGTPEFAPCQAGVRQHAGVSQRDGTQPRRLLAWAKETDQFVAEKSRCEHNQMVSWCTYCSSEARTRDRKPGRVLPGKAGALPETMKHTAVENKHRNTYRDRRAPVAANCTGVKGVGPFASKLYTWCIDSGKVRRERDKE